MTSAATSQLAILGGPKAVTVEPKENWQAPKEEIKAIVNKMIDDGVYVAAGCGVPAQLEEEFRNYIGTKYCLSQNTGTSTLLAAYWAVGVGPGDEVIHPTYTWICAISPVIHLGARPVLCEIDPETLLVDPEDLEKRITPRTKAISVVHLYGNVCDMDAIMAIARKHNLPVIEDCSHCHGAEWDGRKCGSIGDIGCFSMMGDPHLGKPLPGGEGGLVTTNSKELYERILAYGHLNRYGMRFDDPTFQAFAPYNLGLKFRAHPWAMGMGLVMFKSLDERNARRDAYRQKIYDALTDIPGISAVKTYAKSAAKGCFGGMHMMAHPDELGGLGTARLIEALQAEGVDMHHRGYALVHRLKLFAEGYDLFGKGTGPLSGDYPGYPEGSLPVSEEAHGRILGMPTYIEETPGYSSQVINAFRKVTANHKELL